MTRKIIPLTQLPEKKTAEIIELQGGRGFQRKLKVMGIRKGQEIEILSKQPFRGPITIKVGKSHMTLGRRMAQKIKIKKK